jgi:hypothetical protein
MGAAREERCFPGCHRSCPRTAHVREHHRARRRGRQHSCRVSGGGSVVLVDEVTKAVAAVDLALWVPEIRSRHRSHPAWSGFFTVVANGETEAVQLADDPLVTPARILARQAKNQLTGLAADWGRPIRTGYVQRRATRRRCQRSNVVGVTRNDRQVDRGNNRLVAARKDRSSSTAADVSARRTTASSCRSTTISSSLESCERGRSKTSWSRQRNAR